ncbi:hypothetical protein BDU57DRAFT_428707, partial [Ampelomyces quisqualis]
MAPGPALTAHPPPARMPKLKYRNPLPANDNCRLEEPPATPTSKAPSSPSPSVDTASLTSPSLASTSPSAASSNDSNKSSTKKKKKNMGVLGFLSLKEPSQAAFEQYAEAQRKQAAVKGTSSPATRLPSSYAQKKLPENIPKVNSKWDGLPDSLKKRQSKSSHASSKTRHSVTSPASQASQASQNAHFAALPWNQSTSTVMSTESRNPPNSIVSPPPSATELPEMSYYFPDSLDANIVPSQPAQPMPYHPSMIRSSPRSSKSISDVRSSLEHVPGLRPDSPASSADSGDTVVRDIADVIFNKLNDQPQRSFLGVAPAVQPLDEMRGTAVPESHDFLFGDPSTSSPATTHVAHTPTRSVQNFSWPMPSSPTSSSPARSIRSTSYRTTAVSPALPTLYEASMASTDSVDSVDSDETVQTQGDADTHSIAPSTIAPSVLSAHWQVSPRERLGLGGRLRKNAALPWEGQAAEPGKLKNKKI